MSRIEKGGAGLEQGKEFTPKQVRTIVTNEKGPTSGVIAAQRDAIHTMLASHKTGKVVVLIDNPIYGPTYTSTVQALVASGASFTEAENQAFSFALRTGSFGDQSTEQLHERYKTRLSTATGELLDELLADENTRDRIEIQTIAAPADSNRWFRKEREGRHDVKIEGFPSMARYSRQVEMTARLVKKNLKGWQEHLAAREKSTANMLSVMLASEDIIGVVGAVNATDAGIFERLDEMQPQGDEQKYDVTVDAVGDLVVGDKERLILRAKSGILTQKEIEEEGKKIVNHIEVEEQAKVLLPGLYDDLFLMGHDVFPTEGAEVIAEKTADDLVRDREARLTQNVTQIKQLMQELTKNELTQLFTPEFDDTMRTMITRMQASWIRTMQTLSEAWHDDSGSPEEYEAMARRAADAVFNWVRTIAKSDTEIKSVDDIPMSLIRASLIDPLGFEARVQLIESSMATFDFPFQLRSLLPDNSELLLHTHDRAFGVDAASGIDQAKTDFPDHMATKLTKKILEKGEQAITEPDEVDKNVEAVRMHLMHTSSLYEEMILTEAERVIATLVEPTFTERVAAQNSAQQHIHAQMAHLAGLDPDSGEAIPQTTRELVGKIVESAIDEPDAFQARYFADYEQGITHPLGDITATIASGSVRPDKIYFSTQSRDANSGNGSLEDTEQDVIITGDEKGKGGVVYPEKKLGSQQDGPGKDNYKGPFDER